LNAGHSFLRKTGSAGHGGYGLIAIDLLQFPVRRHCHGSHLSGLVLQAHGHIHHGDGGQHDSLCRHTGHAALEVTPFQGFFLIRISFLGTESLDERLEKGFQDFKSLWEDPENLESDLKQRSKELLNNALKKLSERGRAILEKRFYDHLSSEN